MSSGAPLVEVVAGSPQLVIEHICAALELPALAALACCSRGLLKVATHDSVLRPRFERREWALAPLPVSGEELAHRWDTSAENYEAEVYEFSVKALKLELKERGICTQRMLEKSELRAALIEARSADLPNKARVSGKWSQLYFAAQCAEQLRRTVILSKPMRGMLKRHFIGENADAFALHTGEGWQTRWLEVDNQGLLSVAEDEFFSRILAQVQISTSIVARPLEPERVPGGRAHCFTIDNLGVEIAMDATTEENCARWLEKMHLHQQELCRGAASSGGLSVPGGENWRRVRLTQSVVPTLRTLLKRLAVPEFDEHVHLME